MRFFESGNRNRSISGWIGILILFIWALGGCTASRQIEMKSRTERADVFEEVGKEAPLVAGFADLTIRASIKTHLKGHYLFEWGKTHHGEDHYHFLVNVDGQAVNWVASGTKEEIVATPAQKRNPEVGEGMRYILERKIRLAPGRHRIFFALPDPGEGVAMEIAIALLEENANSLEFKPIYRSGRRFTRDFKNGVFMCDAFFNGKFVPPLKRGEISAEIR